MKKDLGASPGLFLGVLFVGVAALLAVSLASHWSAGEDLCVDYGGDPYCLPIADAKAAVVGMTVAVEMEDDLLITQRVTRRDGIGHFIIDGQVKNRGEHDWKFVEVSASAYDRSGKLVDNDWSYIRMTRLRPGDVSPFTIYIEEEGRGIVKYDLKLTGGRRD